MARNKKDRVEALLKEFGRTYSEEIGIRLANSPAPLFQLLVASILYSARIGSQIATQAAKELFDAGYRTPRAMAGSTWKKRVQVLNRAGYARYQERTSTMLGDVAEHLNERWGGDLRKLRDEAERDPGRERALLKEFKGIGDAGVDIFFREVQAVWDEVAPYADRRALQAARRLDLGDAASDLARLTDRKSYPRLVAALVRVHQDDLFDRVDPGPADGDGAEAGATKQELYERARRLDIPGRSRMTKEELAEAVAGRS
jgi:hypothetical protein